ncbi:MAG TPA: DUF2795 domain-containing protein [Candidatus Aquilonibacter sp.]|nr:DUF2795 domain-containing protein [Candidatus Aquilonibacter sp.]
MNATPFSEYSAIAHAMKGVDFPARRKQLLETAIKNNAGENVLKDLQRLSERHEYKNVAEVMHAIGHAGAPA